jgi:hypothetical protein
VGEVFINWWVWPILYFHFGKSATVSATNILSWEILANTPALHINMFAAKSLTKSTNCARGDYRRKTWEYPTKPMARSTASSSKAISKKPQQTGWDYSAELESNQLANDMNDLAIRNYDGVKKIKCTGVMQYTFVTGTPSIKLWFGHSSSYKEQSTVFGTFCCKD